MKTAKSQILSKLELNTKKSHSRSSRLGMVTMLSDHSKTHRERNGLSSADNAERELVTIIWQGIAMMPTRLTTR